MTMRFVPIYRRSSSTDALSYVLYKWLDFMRTASPGGPGWTVVRSCNGTNYTDDGVGGLPDNILSGNSLLNFDSGVSRSYFVLRSPDLGGGTYKELLWHRHNTTTSDWVWRTIRSGDPVMTGGNLWTIPAGSNLLCQIDSGAGTQEAMIAHMGAGNEAL